MNQAPAKAMGTIFEQYGLVPTFDIFWEEYQKKVGKVAAEKWWNKLSAKEKQDCMEAVPLYVASTPEKQFRKDPERYLRHKAFYDEIIDRTGRRGASAEQHRADTFDATAQLIARRRAERASGAGPAVRDDQGGRDNPHAAAGGGHDGQGGASGAPRRQDR